MKIRSYKGNDLGKIYQTINKELGPKAVVIQPENGGGMSKLLKGGTQELIAIVDDAEGDRYILDNAVKSDQILKEISSQKTRQKELERLMMGLRDEMASIAEVYAENSSLPEQLAQWDDDFLAQALDLIPGLADFSIDSQSCTKLAGLFDVAEPNVKRSISGPCIMLLSGPTGSGKTTTMAKLAAEFCLGRKLKVGLVTTDTYRIGAVEQTQEYAQLLGIDLKIALSSKELRYVLDGYADKDVVLIDTPGRSPLDLTSLRGMKGLVEGVGDITNLILVPACTKNSNVDGILSSFGDLGTKNYIVVTKLDETRDFSLFTALASAKVGPIAYLTDGQRVPNDFSIADALNMAQLLLARESIENVA